MRFPLATGVLWACVVSMTAPGAAASPGAGVAAPPAVTAVDIEEKLGGSVPADLTFTDGGGHRVRIGDLLRPGRPVLLVLAYYRCPMLCDLVLSGIGRPLRDLGWTPGQQVEAVTVSIDPQETLGAARLKQGAVLQAMNRPDAAAGWPFLVGDERSIRALADAVGFRYAYDPQSRQFAHPAVVMVLTPEGRISRYLYGVTFRVLDLRLASVEASQGRIGSIVDRVLLTCFHYDPSARRYGFYVSSVLKGGASAVMLSVGAMLFVLWRRDIRRTRGGRT